MKTPIEKLLQHACIQWISPGEEAFACAGEDYTQYYRIDFDKNTMLDLMRIVRDEGIEITLPDLICDLQNAGAIVNINPSGFVGYEFIPDVVGLERGWLDVKNSVRYAQANDAWINMRARIEQEAPQLLEDFLDLIAETNEVLTIQYSIGQEEMLQIEA